MDTSHAPLVEESDIASIPALKLSLSPEELKRVVVSLEAKVKYRVLKSDWRQNSFKRLEHLQSRTDDYRSQQAAQFNNTSFEAKVKGLEEEVSAKNDTIRTISLEVNLLNNEIANFLKRHKLTSRGHVSTIVSLGASGAADTTSSASHWTTGRFRHVESEISAIAQRLKGLLGEGTEAGDSGNSLSDVSHKTKQVQELIRELEAKLDSVTRDRDEALDLLQPGKKSGAESSAVQVVQKYLQTEQKNRHIKRRAVDATLGSPWPRSPIMALPGSG
ncbi:uncharacterized protein LOC101858743 [Aplysia californica]|uniref:Uncharacterized protein LOC101858743 n=1 Tax=Aplysia californica TaxID=6500 RepID=A0ABM1ABB9_APLCA|nr:uncharacterized protein LOC101858743 [Aplysia californica]